MYAVVFVLLFAVLSACHGFSFERFGGKVDDTKATVCQDPQTETLKEWCEEHDSSHDEEV